MSRATMVDLPPEEDQETTDTLDNEANEIQQLDLNLDVEQPPQEEPTLPEKYQGKSLEQVVQLHQEAEKLLANILGGALGGSKEDPVIEETDLEDSEIAEGEETAPDSSESEGEDVKPTEEEAKEDNSEES